MRVCVVGLGYVGLPTAAVLADHGHQVVGVDTNPAILEAVRRGRPHIREPGLPELVARVVGAGALTVADAPVAADAFVIAVPTPLMGIATKRADLGAVEAAAGVVAGVLRHGNLVVLESTSPPGTTGGVLRTTLEAGSSLRAGHEFQLAYCPERILPGRILEELVGNDRVVGGIDVVSAEAAAALYRSFARGEVCLTDATTAELVKLMENTFRDVNIALANEFALVAEELGVDVWQAIELANRHPRIDFLRPGPGVGGHCIAVDPWFVIGAAPRVTSLISTSRAVNDLMPGHVAEVVDRALGSLRGAVVVALGLTYKAGVDDTRESPSLEVVDALRGAGAEVRLHDAVVRPEPSVAELAHGADCLLLLVDHAGYRSLAPSALTATMRRPVVVDTRNFFAAAAWREAGFEVVRLGAGVPQRPTSGGAALARSNSASQVGDARPSRAARQAGR
jgi:UDP-N-acetyl-D-mannosaminuronic acid dehydrogenase